jgi:hypothetical protein
VASALVNECPVCTKILKELFGDGVEGIEVEVSATAGELPEAQLPVGVWVLHHEHVTEEVGYTAEA